MRALPGARALRERFGNPSSRRQEAPKCLGLPRIEHGQVRKPAAKALRFHWQRHSGLLEWTEKKRSSLIERPSALARSGSVRQIGSL
jgi:hypothetical protein